MYHLHFPVLIIRKSIAYMSNSSRDNSFNSRSRSLPPSSNKSCTSPPISYDHACLFFYILKEWTKGVCTPIRLITWQRTRLHKILKTSLKEQLIFWYLKWFSCVYNTNIHVFNSVPNMFALYPFKLAPQKKLGNRSYE